MLLKIFNILITGSDNYNNINKFNNVMDDLLNQLPLNKMIYNFGLKYGALILGRLFALSLNIPYQEWLVLTYFKHKSYNKVPYYRLYAIMLTNAIKKSDLVVIFSNVLNLKLLRLIKLCKKQDKLYIIIKE